MPRVRTSSARALLPRGAAAPVDFGAYLKSCRERAGLRSQRDAVRALEKRRVRVSQGLIAHYESGRVADPDAGILAALASLYGVRFVEVLLRLARSKHETVRGTRDEIEAAQWDLLEAALTPVGTIETTTGLERDELRARAALLGDVQVIDAEGIANWQRSIERLETFWVLAPYFLDDEDDRVLEAVVENLRRGVRYTYFLYKEGEARFEALRETLRARLGPRARARGATEAVWLPAGALTWLHADYVVANPSRRSKAVGFQNLRHLGKTRFALRLPGPDLLELIDKVTAWMSTVERRG